MKKVLIFVAVFLNVQACDDIIEVVDISEKTVTVLAPKDQAVLNTGSVSFSWQPLEDAESYQVQVATPTFNEATQIVLDTIVTKTNISGTLEANNYEWRVKAKNSAYETAYVTQSFHVAE